MADRYTPEHRAVGTTYFVGFVRYAVPADENRATIWLGVGGLGRGYRDDFDQEKFPTFADAAKWCERRMTAKLSNGIIHQGAEVREYHIVEDNFDWKGETIHDGVAKAVRTTYIDDHLSEDSSFTYHTEEDTER